MGCRDDSLFLSFLVPSHILDIQHVYYPQKHKGYFLKNKGYF